MQLLLDLHAVGFERVMEMVANGGEAGLRTIDDFGRDPLVSSLLVLYGLHPLDFESRVAQAIEKVRPQVRKGRRIGTDQHPRRRGSTKVTGSPPEASTGKTLRGLVEDGLYEGAPDRSTLVIEGLEDEAGSSGFVPLGKLGGVIASTSAMSD